MNPRASSDSANPLPLAVGDLLRRMAGAGGDGVAELATRACEEAVRAIGRGDSCLPLERLAGRTSGELRREADALSGDGDGTGGEAAGGDGFRFPETGAIEDALRACPAIVACGDGERIVPFVLEGGRLYTRRNHRCERRIRERLDAMAGRAAESAGLPERDALADGLSAEQRGAVETILARRGGFAILTGGPGTGKTHVLARAVRIAMGARPDLRVRLAAPTGKAAARMAESFAASFAEGEGGDIPMPAASTLHRLIGQNPSTGAFRHHAGNPLPVDWLVIDEASMVDLLLFGHVLDALPEGAGLLLIGDPHQLASVERGRILRDLCDAAGDGGGARYPVARLSASFRFPSDGTIARFAGAVNEGDAETAFDVLRNAPEGCELAWTPHPAGAAGGPEAWPGFREAVLAGFRELAGAATPAEALRRVNGYRVLCAVRRGPFGVERANAAIRGWLPSGAPMPVMVVHNDPSLGVNNGDLGVVMASDRDTVWLEPETRGGEPRRVPRLLLPDLEPAWATTVHKSQGSEYDDVAIVLPGDPSCPLLTREILYTAVTRTRHGVRLWAGADAVGACIRRPVVRASGLGG